MARVQRQRTVGAKWDRVRRALFSVRMQMRGAPHDCGRP